ncbi:MAG TPA: ATP-binding protein, partial [Ktedonobacterales bacterium]|nr:ATP-binding protein [Ktedonobacterales bacterium]
MVPFAIAPFGDAEEALVLLGEVGVGKTALLLALVRSLAERWVVERKVVRLVTVPDFLRELRAGYDVTQQQGEGYDALMERYQTCDVLVFDDLGAEKLTDGGGAVLPAAGLSVSAAGASPGVVELSQGGAGAAAHIGGCWTD